MQLRGDGLRVRGTWAPRVRKHQGRVWGGTYQPGKLVISCAIPSSSVNRIPRRKVRPWPRLEVSNGVYITIITYQGVVSGYPWIRARRVALPKIQVHVWNNFASVYIDNLDINDEFNSRLVLPYVITYEISSDIYSFGNNNAKLAGLLLAIGNVSYKWDEHSGPTVTSGVKIHSTEGKSDGKEWAPEVP